MAAGMAVEGVTRERGTLLPRQSLGYVLASLGAGDVHEMPGFGESFRRALPDGAYTFTVAFRVDGEEVFVTACELTAGSDPPEEAYDPPQKTWAEER